MRILADRQGDFGLRLTVLQQLNLEGLGLFCLEITAHGLCVPLLAGALEGDPELLHAGRNIQVVEAAAVTGDEVYVGLLIHHDGEREALGKFVHVDF